MARLDRREKLALDESYKYYRSLDADGAEPNLYKLAHCLKTVNHAIELTGSHEFKLTVQLWKRIQQGLFDKLITNFSGYVIVSNGDGSAKQPKSDFPDVGMVEFHAEGLRRADDIFRMEIKHIYPATFYNLSKAWKKKGANLTPADFPKAECGDGGCFVKPVLLGVEVLDNESKLGKEKAYHEWWDLYWQAYCTKSKNDRHTLYRKMDELELAWGNLYY